MTDERSRRRRLARAIRGPIPKSKLTKRALYAQFRAGENGLDHESALLLAEAFGITSAERNAAWSRALRRAARNRKVETYYREMVEGGVREEAARQMAEALVDPVQSLPPARRANSSA